MVLLCDHQRGLQTVVVLVAGLGGPRGGRRTVVVLVDVLGEGQREGLQTTIVLLVAGLGGLQGALPEVALDPQGVENLEVKAPLVAGLLLLKPLRERRHGLVGARQGLVGAAGDRLYLQTAHLDCTFRL